MLWHAELIRTHPQLLSIPGLRFTYVTDTTIHHIFTRVYPPSRRRNISKAWHYDHYLLTVLCKFTHQTAITTVVEIICSYLFRRRSAAPGVQTAKDRHSLRTRQGPRFSLVGSRLL